MLRFLPLSMLRRRKKHIAFVGCVILFFSMLSTVQYVIISLFVVGKSTADVGEALEPEAEMELSPPLDSRRRRPLGIAMPSLDYAAFKDLERRNATSGDPAVLTLARGAMLAPAGNGRWKIRAIKKSRQAVIVDTILQNKTSGFFVECGAFDGDTASNTVYLERYRHWTGLLIEMDAAFYTQLVGKQRNAWSINACLSSKKHLVEMKYFESNGQLGRLADADSAADRRHISRLPNSAFCFPLESLLLALNRTHVDYFSLDVEGFELDILRSIPFNRLDIDVVSAEYLHTRESPAAYTELMAGYGYKLYARVSNMDFVFVRNGLLADLARQRRREESEKVRKQQQHQQHDDVEIFEALDVQQDVVVDVDGVEIDQRQQQQKQPRRKRPQQQQQREQELGNNDNIIYN